MSKSDMSTVKELMPQFEHFGTTVVVPGMLLKQALINAKHEKFNRAFTKFADIELYFDLLYRNVPDDWRLDTDDDQYDRHTYMMIPISFMNWHYHRDGQECERHARVMINVPGMFRLTDIEEEAWTAFLAAEGKVTIVERSC